MKICWQVYREVLGNLIGPGGFRGLDSTQARIARETLERDNQLHISGYCRPDEPVSPNSAQRVVERLKGIEKG